MLAKSKTRVLCVDDDDAVLSGTSRLIERRYTVDSAASGAEALAFLERSPGVAVILSDMRMPSMNGATFLALSRKIAPDAVRVLLTGQSDMDSAIRAVNDGQIFHFLTKPCPTPQLMATIDAAVEQHRLIVSERELLEQTLHGCIKALTDVLALTNPVAFGRAQRIKRLVGELCSKLELRDTWQVEVAAMFSQLAHIALPTETAEKLYFGRPLNVEEQRDVDRLPVVTEQLLANIPRIEIVRTILSDYQKPPAPESDGPTADNQLASVGSRILRVAVDYDVLESRGNAPQLALDTMRSRESCYARSVLDAAYALRGDGSAYHAIKELPPCELLVGMLLAEDVFMPSGILLIARGHEITPRFMERMRNLPASAVQKRIRVRVRTSATVG